jgi:hypothetical protein
MDLDGAIRRALVIDAPVALGGAERGSWEAGRDAAAAAVLQVLDAETLDARMARVRARAEALQRSRMAVATTIR